MAMKHRVLRRKVIIREYDFNKIKGEALGNHFDGAALYDRVSWVPINQDTLEKLKLQEILKGKTGPLTLANLDLKMPALLIAQLKDYLYDKRYYDWRVTTDEEGFLCVQSRTNTPRTRLGWGVFEKDLTCRI
jgi:hypothetical protein